MLQFSVRFLQVLLAATFIVIPVSRVFGAPTLQQVLSLGVPLWLIWIANVIDVLLQWPVLQAFLRRL